MTSHVGSILREWRLRRHRSQLDLSLEVGVSAKHLSFVETGRSRPSPELVVAIGEHLEVPLRERNVMLLAAGYAPRYAHTPFDDAAMARIRQSLQRMLDAHHPYPGVVIDRQWNVVQANDSAAALADWLPDDLLSPTINVFRVCLHPDGLAALTLNLDDWATYLLCRLRRAIQLTSDPHLVELESEILSYPNLAHLDLSSEAGESEDPPLLVPLVLGSDAGTMSMFTTLTTFGTPRDVTLDELAVELFFPADDATDAALRARAGPHTADHSARP